MPISSPIKEISKNAFALGNVIAVAISFSINHSILWCIAHGIFGWFYVIYYAISY